ncbi:MAG: replication initiator protein A [Deltaproteobacteria bacterium]|nr:replication initiator protein A [Deltaproteobacteria bacterium]
MPNGDKKLSISSEVLDSTDRAGANLSKKTSGKKIIREASEYVKAHIRRQPPVQRFFSFMPTMLTRVSPFHFKGRHKSTEWPLVRLDSGDANSWGSMQVVGELLIIFDETILFCLLALMTRSESDAFETSFMDLARIAGIDPTQTNNAKIWQSIQRLAGTRIDLKLFSGKGKKRKTLKELTGSILSFAEKDQAGGGIRIVINPYFLEMYAESFVTNIDMNFRSRLKSDISKAFYRFYQGLYESQAEIDITRLAQAVNLNIAQEMKQLKSKVRIGLRELQEKGYLEAYKITRDNRVRVSKTADAAVKFESQILGNFNIEFLVE